MAITNILRDWASSVSIVRIMSSDNLATVGAAGYLTAQQANIDAINIGPFAWVPSDFILVYASDGWGLFTISADFTTLNEFSESATFPLPAHTLFGNPTGVTANGIPVTLGTGLSFSGTTLNATGGGLTWSVQTVSTKQMAVNNGYISNKLTLVTYTLPPVAGTNPGDIVRVVGFEAGGWKIAQNAAQTIHFGLDNSTPGASGFIASTSEHDCAELVALSGNDWILANSIGNITFN